MPQTPPLVGYDEPPKPRVLVQGDVLQQIVDGLVPTCAPMPHEGWDVLRPESWDAVISLGSPPWGGSDRHLYLQFGGRPFGFRKTDRGGASISLRESMGRETYLPAVSPHGWREEIKNSLIPWVRRTEPPRSIFPQQFAAGLEPFVPLAVDADGYALAAIYKPTNAAGVIWLPDEALASREWILLALELWSEQQPDTFPACPDWSTRDEWMSIEELRERDRVRAAQQALEDTVEELENALSEAKRSLRDARETADITVRRLVTGSGAELVAEVVATLTEFGFGVEDRDALGAREKLEDLRVTSGEFVAIAEVKGVAKGGSTTHLLQMSRFVKAFAKECGQYPSAQWYIANHFRDRDPDSRAPLLKGQDESSVETFGEDDGLVIDTRTLFRLRRDVAEGKVPPGAARELLMKGRGRFEYPQPDTE